MKEFGGYLEFEHYYGREYHKNAIALNTARNCLRYIIKKYNITEIYLPRYLCNCISDVCLGEKVNIVYYSINEKFEPQINNLLKSDSFIYVINFYGQLNNEYLFKLKQKFKNLIVDNVQSFFLKPITGIDTIYTCRKYFGVSDGAYLYTDEDLKMNYTIDSSYNRMKFLIGRYEKSGAEFFKDFHYNENLLDNESIKYMSKITHNIMRSINYEDVISKRKNNFRILHNELMGKNILNIKNEAGLFLYPLLIDKGHFIKNKLISNKVYVPTFWPGVEKLVDDKSFERKLYDDLVLLPIDQRYDEKDMEIILERVSKAIKEVTL